MKNNYKFTSCLFAVAVAACATTQSAVADGDALAPPAGNFLVLSNCAGTVRVLDSKGLVMEKNLTYLPRIPLTDLSVAQLHALLETKTAYAGLTTCGSVSATNSQGAVVERQVEQAWHQESSLAGRIQTRLEILEDLRDYNTEIALLPGSMSAASQYEANAIPINNRLTNHAANVAVAAAQVAAAENYRAAGGADAPQVEHQAQAVYQQTATRLERANDRAMISNGQIAGANQEIANHLAKCAALAARLASHGINVAGAPPFSPIPLLMLQTDVDKERKAQ